ncbi:MAG: BlaI/MecI/CopY family transcriptional regulator [Oliverpabstia sp.]
MSKYRLSPNEQYLMNIFWDIGKPLTSADLSQYVKEWKNGYLQNVLTSLTKKGMIECVNILQHGRRFLKQYKITITKEEYAARMISSLHFNKQSIPQIALALAKELSNDERDEVIHSLEKIVEDFKNNG